MPLKDSGSDIMAQQEDKSLNIPLEPPIKKIEFNVSDIEDCPDEKTLQLAIGIAKGIVSPISRDTRYRKIVDAALCSANIETAMIAASRINSSIRRDSAYMEIVKISAKMRNYELSNKAARKINSSIRHDKAKSYILDSMSNK